MFRVRTTFTGVTGSPWLSTFYFDSETSGTAQQAATAAGTFWGAVDAFMDNSITWATEPDVAIVNAATGNVTSAVGITPVIGSGAATSDPLPYANQGLVRWLSGVYVGGRQIRGRTFVPGICENSVGASGTLGATEVAAFTAAGTALIADANADLEIWSPTLGQSVTASIATTWSQFAVLRSRRD